MKFTQCTYMVLILSAIKIFHGANMGTAYIVTVLHIYPGIPR